jgi:flagellar protein FlaG
MRIEGMDATNNNYSNVKSSDTEVKEVKPVKEVKSPKINSIDSKSISQISEFEKKEMPISDKVVVDAIERANKAISIANRKFEYSIHEKTHEIMIKVIDSDTNEIIREIPPEKILDMVAKMWEMAGLIVDERR